MRQDLVLKKPLITERSMIMAAKGTFTFEVDSRANKAMIAQVVAKYFKVDVIGVATSSIKSKIRRFGAKRMPSTLPKSKKAMVTLKKGQKIDLFEIKAEK